VALLAPHSRGAILLLIRRCIIEGYSFDRAFGHAIICLRQYLVRRRVIIEILFARNDRAQFKINNFAR
jgi:hypothetical protein